MEVPRGGALAKHAPCSTGGVAGRGRGCTAPTGRRNVYECAQHPPPHRARSSKTLHHAVVTDEPITVSDIDDGLAAALSDRINEFNTDATGFDDGR